MEIEKFTADHRALRLYFPFLNFHHIVELPHIFSSCTWSQEMSSDWVIAVPGPGLIEAMPLIRRCKGKVPIMALQRSIPFLLDHGIVPDFAVCLDSGLGPYNHFARLSAEQRFSTIALLSYNVNPDIYEIMPYIWTYSGQYKNDNIVNSMLRQDCAMIAPMETVLPTAVQIACQKGASSVWVVGSDLDDNRYANGNNRNRDSMDMFDTKIALGYLPRMYSSTDLFMCSDTAVKGWHNCPFDPEIKNESFNILDLIRKMKRYERDVFFEENQLKLLKRYCKIFNDNVVQELTDRYNEIKCRMKTRK